MDVLAALRTTVESIKAWVDEKKVDKIEYNNDVAEINANFQTTSESIKTWTNENKVDKTEYNNDVLGLSERIQVIEDSLYQKISITSFSAGTAENGQTVTSTTLNWTTNKTPKALSLDGVSISATSKNYKAKDFSATFNSNKTWVLTATGERNETVSKSTSIVFLNRVYYGVAEEPANYDRDFILSLDKKILSSGKVKSFNIDAGNGSYVYYCLPTSMGECLFNVGGFDGGFQKVESAMIFSNQHEYEEPYDIWRTNEIQKGSITITVS